MNINRLLLLFIMVLTISMPMAIAEFEVLPGDKYDPPINVYFYIENNLCGLKNSEGEVLIPPQFDFVSFWHIDSEDVWNHIEGEYNFCYALTMKDGLCGLIASDGTEITPPIWERIAIPSSDRCFRVQKNGLWGEIDSSGKIISEINEQIGDLWAPD